MEQIEGQVEAVMQPQAERRRVDLPGGMSLELVIPQNAPILQDLRKTAERGIPVVQALVGLAKLLEETL